MDDLLRARLRAHLAAIVLCLLTLLYGFSLGGVFGAAEGAVKHHLRQEAMSVLDEVYEGRENRVRSVQTQAFTYLKRAHLHAGGLGAAGLVQILLLAFVRPPSRWTRLTAWALGLGGLLYSMYWMFAGLKAPAMGGTDEARESLEWLAIPSSGAVLLGTAATIALTIQGARARSSAAP